MSKLHDDTTSARVSLHGRVSQGTPFGKFVSNNGRIRIINNRDEISYCLRVPSFRVIQLGEDGKVLGNTESDRMSALKSKPAKTSKLSVQGDGWGGAEMQEKGADEARAEMQESVDNMESAWLKEEEAKAQAANMTEDEEAELKSEEANEKLNVAALDQGEEAPKNIEAVHSETFSKTWKPNMSNSKLTQLFEKRTGETLEKGLKKRELLNLHEAQDALDEGQ